VLAWLAGSAFGVLAVNTELVAGPLAGIAGGVDVSALGSGAVAALVYLAAAAVVAGLVDPPRPTDPNAGVPTVRQHTRPLVEVPVGEA
jgi:hypothetical protein